MPGVRIIGVYIHNIILHGDISLRFSFLIAVSHTTDDLIFTWDPQMPLDVDKGIKLPKFKLISTKNDDCTTVYSTGKNSFV